MPDACTIAVYLGGYCEEPELRNRLLRRMLQQFKGTGKIALADWQAYVKENWSTVKAEHEAKERGVFAD